MVPSPLVADRDILRCCTNLVATGAKRSLTRRHIKLPGS
jgi:hypothetical protein